MLKEKQEVIIYLDPLTREEPEGPAILIKKIEGDYGVYEGHPVGRWQVRFTDGESRLYYRTVLDTSVTVDEDPESADDEDDDTGIHNLCPECESRMEILIVSANLYRCPTCRVELYESDIKERWAQAAQEPSEEVCEVCHLPLDYQFGKGYIPHNHEDAAPQIDAT